MPQRGLRFLESIWRRHPTKGTTDNDDQAHVSRPSLPPGVTPYTAHLSTTQCSTVPCQYGLTAICDRCIAIGSRLREIIKLTQEHESCLCSLGETVTWVDQVGEITSCQSCKSILDYRIRIRAIVCPNQVSNCQTCQDVMDVVLNEWRTTPTSKRNDPKDLRVRIDVQSRVYSTIPAFIIQNLSSQNVQQAEEYDIHKEANKRVDWACLDLETVQSWIHLCDSEHTRCKLNLSHNSSVDLLLVDVKRQCLISKPAADPKYVALSYVWGKAPVTKTTSSNFERLKEPGSLSAESEIIIPNTIRDAMELTSALGLNYLWVDNMCVQQDDENVQHVLNSMHSIYAGAYLTIVAAAGMDAGHGLKGISANRPRKYLSRIRFPDECYTVAALHRGTTSERLLSTPWARRGWTYQEGHFSRRALVFYEDLVEWHCRMGAKVEVESMVAESVPELCHPLSSEKSLLEYHTLLKIFQ